MNIRVTEVDHAPDDLYAQVPFTAKLLRELPGPDRPDYWLAELLQPLQWVTDEGTSEVTHLVLGARWVGGAIAPGMRDTPINIAYVTDTSLLDDQQLDFRKCAYVAIGTADAGETGILAPPKALYLRLSNAVARVLGRDTRP